MINVKAGTLMNKIRREYNMDMMKASKLLGVSQPMLVRIEQGKQPITLEYIEKFCTLFDLSLSSFMSQLESLLSEE
jgi:transcriptional regulator with XRE-family HTH domain